MPWSPGRRCHTLGIAVVVLGWRAISPRPRGTGCPVLGWRSAWRWWSSPALVFALEQAGGGGSGPLGAIATAAESTQREAGGHAFIHATITASDTPEGVTETGSIVFENGGRTRGTLV